MAEVTEGSIVFQGGSTWCRLTGNLSSPRPPLVVLHGGPGAAHDYVERFALLADTGRAVIHYDQFGCGRSSHRPDMGTDFWTVRLFLDELDTVLAHFGIADRYHLLGQSWGGMLAAEHAVSQPKGLRGLVIANSPASMHTWVAEANRLRAALPADVQAVLIEHENAGTTSDPAYEQAVQVFYERHLCRVTPFPDELQRSLASIGAEPTVYHTMNGPSEFHVVGTLRDWTVEDRLSRIVAPTLVISGRHDEATEACVRPYAECIKGARWVIFENSSHTPHIEETEAVMRTVGDFLSSRD